MHYRKFAVWMMCTCVVRQPNTVCEKNGAVLACSISDDCQFTKLSWKLLWQYWLQVVCPSNIQLQVG